MPLLSWWRALEALPAWRIDDGWGLGRDIDAAVGAAEAEAKRTEALDAWRELGRRMLDPDDLGYAVTQDVRDAVRRLLA